MTMKCNLHWLTKVEAREVPMKATWLDLTDKDGNQVTVFMPLRCAEMMAEAFAEYETWESSQEGPTYDDALGAKCDAEAALARQLKEAGRA